MKLVRCNNRLEETNNLMNHFFGKELFSDNSYLQGGKHYNTPKVNIEETKDNFNIEVAVPGFTKNDFKIAIENNILTIEATKENEQKKAYSHFEFSYGTFKRSFTLPEHKINETTIEAQYDNGILNVTLPKKEEAKAKAKRLIDII